MCAVATVIGGAALAFTRFGEGAEEASTDSPPLTAPDASRTPTTGRVTSVAPRQSSVPASSSDSPVSAPASTIAPPTTSPTTVAATSVAPTSVAPVSTAPVVVPTTPTVPATTPASLQPAFADGLFRVGSDIQPGRYIVPTIAPGSTCFWERRSGFSGEIEDVLATDVPIGRTVVDVLPTDAGFFSRGCLQWFTQVSPPVPSTTFGDGDWIVGDEIPPGRYATAGGPGCSWARASGFTHTLEELITTGQAEGPVVIDVEPTDARISSRACGTWSPA
jgi:hypothetical protein